MSQSAIQTPPRPAPSPEPAPMPYSAPRPWPLLLLQTMRPKQWTKNGFVFAALLFDGKLFQAEPLLNSLVGFAVFCLLSSAVYLVNDARDVEADRAHPTKRFRPIAAGVVPEWMAYSLAVGLAVVSLVIAWWVTRLPFCCGLLEKTISGLIA